MFDLDKFKAGQLAVTRGGSVAKFVAYVEEARGQKLAALVDGDLLIYSEDGRFRMNESHLDLIAMKPRVAVLWVNRCKDGGLSVWGSEQEADQSAALFAPNRIGGKALRIEIPMED